jgi:sterol desaturase/sphingolipid hydroxylase (fatty acid hydroxylase superfamily)
MSYAGYLLLTAVIYVAFGIYDHAITPLICSALQPAALPDKAPRLQKLELIDRVFITFSKLVTGLFIYHSILFITSGEELSRMSIDFSAAAIGQSVLMLPVHLPVMFIIYDFFYTLFHWALHWPPLYAYVHKHHHRQMSPFRGNTDAINVHPFEYVVGEYNHLWTLFLLTRVLPAGSVHAVTFLVFVVLGGALASLNHTRHDIRIPYVYNVNAHDFHHRQYRCNYGQYIMLWDLVFGTFMPYTLEQVNEPKQK